MVLHKVIYVTLEYCIHQHVIGIVYLFEVIQEK